MDDQIEYHKETNFYSPKKWYISKIDNWESLKWKDG